MEERVSHRIKNIHSSHPGAARKVPTRYHRVHHWLHPRGCIERHFSSTCIENMMFAQSLVTVGIRKPATRIAFKNSFQRSRASMTDAQEQACTFASSGVLHLNLDGRVSNNVLYC